MMCVDSNHDGKVDFTEFTDRFHNPAKDIGFTMAVLLTNLSEHMPNEPRWALVLLECPIGCVAHQADHLQNEPWRVLVQLQCRLTVLLTNLTEHMPSGSQWVADLLG